MPEKENPEFVIDAFVIRVGVLALAAFLLFSVLVIRLWNMQVIRASEFEYKDRKQSARSIRVPAMRGEILRLAAEGYNKATVTSGNTE